MNQFSNWIPYVLYIAIAITMIYLITTAMHAMKLLKALAPIRSKSNQLKSLSTATSNKVTILQKDAEKMVNKGKKLLPVALLLYSIRQEYNEDETADWKTSAKRALKKKRERDEILKLAARRMQH